MTSPTARFKQLEQYFGAAILVIFILLVLWGFYATFVPLGNERRLFMALNSNYLKNNHAIIAHFFLNLDKSKFHDFRETLLSKFNKTSPRDSVNDYRLQNIFIHSLAGIQSVGAIEETLISIWKEPIPQPFWDTQKITSLFIVLRSNDIQFIYKQKLHIDHLASDTNNSEIILLSKDILKLGQ